MNKPHKHAKLIKAWADGAKIEYKFIYDRWYPKDHPQWDEMIEYRIKPEPKPDVVKYGLAVKEQGYLMDIEHPANNLKLTFDGETGELKSAEVLK